MADQTPLGNLDVIISADWSDLQSEVNAAVAASQTAADTIEAAFNGIDTSEAVASIGFLGGAAHSAAEDVANLGQAAESSTSGVGSLDDATAPLAGSLGEVGSAASAGASELGSFSSGAEEAAGSAGQAEEGIAGLITEGLALGGIALSAETVAEAFKEIVTESLEAYASVQTATIALTALTGSASQANEQIENLKSLALSDAISFPSLVTATQRMTAFGIASDEIPTALNAAADAAAATGNGFDQVTNSMNRMVLSGTAGARQLVQLGLSATDLANVMGVSADQMAAAFKEMDPSDRINIIVEALGKYQGVAQQVAEGIAGQFQNLKTETDYAFEAIGEDIAPAAEAVLKFATGVVENVTDTATAIGNAGSAIADFFKTVTGLTASQGATLLSFFKQLGQSFGTQFTAPFQLAAAVITQTTNTVSGTLKGLGITVDDLGNALQTQSAKAVTSNVAQSASMLNLGIALTGESAALKTVETAQVAANKAVTDAQQAYQEAQVNVSIYAAGVAKGTATQQQLTLAQQDANRAQVALDKAVVAATPHGADYAASIAGIEAAIDKAQQKANSSISVFQSLDQQFGNDSDAIGLLASAYNKAETAAKAAGVAFASAAGEAAKQQIAYQQASASAQAMEEALGGLVIKYYAAVAAGQDTTDISQQIALSYKAVEAEVAKTGGTYQNTTAQLIAANVAGVNATNNLESQASLWEDLAGQTNKTAAQMASMNAIFKTVQTDSAAVGLSVQQVGNSLIYSLAPGIKMTDQMQAFLTTMNSAAIASGNLVIKNGVLVPTLSAVADAASAANAGIGGMNATINAAGVIISGLGTAATTAAPQVAAVGTAAQNTGAQAQNAGTQIINLNKNMDGIYETVFTGAPVVTQFGNAIKGLGTAAQGAGPQIINLNKNMDGIYDTVFTGAPIVTQFGSSLTSAGNAAKGAGPNIASVGTAVTGVAAIINGVRFDNWATGFFQTGGAATTAATQITSYGTASTNVGNILANVPMKASLAATAFTDVATAAAALPAKFTSIDSSVSVFGDSIAQGTQGLITFQQQAQETDGSISNITVSVTGLEDPLEVMGSNAQIAATHVQTLGQYATTCGDECGDLTNEVEDFTNAAPAATSAADNIASGFNAMATAADNAASSVNSLSADVAGFNNILAGSIGAGASGGQGITGGIGSLVSQTINGVTTTQELMPPDPNPGHDHWVQSSLSWVPDTAPGISTGTSGGWQPGIWNDGAAAVAANTTATTANTTATTASTTATGTSIPVMTAYTSNLQVAGNTLGNAIPTLGNLGNELAIAVPPVVALNDAVAATTPVMQALLTTSDSAATEISKFGTNASELTTAQQNYESSVADATNAQDAYTNAVLAGTDSQAQLQQLYAAAQSADAAMLNQVGTASVQATQALTTTANTSLTAADELKGLGINASELTSAQQSYYAAVAASTNAQNAFSNALNSGTASAAQLTALLQASYAAQEAVNNATGSASVGNANQSSSSQTVNMTAQPSEPPSGLTQMQIATGAWEPDYANGTWVWNQNAQTVGGAQGSSNNFPGASAGPGEPVDYSSNIGLGLSGTNPNTGLPISGAPSITLAPVFNFGTVVGSNAAQQLVNLVMPQVVAQLRQAGVKI